MKDLYTKRGTPELSYPEFSRGSDFGVKVARRKLFLKAKIWSSLSFSARARSDALAERWTTDFGNVLQISLSILTKSQQLLSMLAFMKLHPLGHASAGNSFIRLSLTFTLDLESIKSRGSWLEKPQVWILPPMTIDINAMNCSLFVKKTKQLQGWTVQHFIKCQSWWAFQECTVLSTQPLELSSILYLICWSSSKTSAFCWPHLFFSTKAKWMQWGTILCLSNSCCLPLGVLC